ncbi:MAG: putative short-subunit dehydrogenase-like oxidoreductase (DUF2520 family) [Parvicellaceae bacterium]
MNILINFTLSKREVDKINEIVIIGAGNVASNLAVRLHDVGANVNQIYSPNLLKSKALAELVNAKTIASLEEVDKDTELIIIAIPDDKLPFIAEQLPEHINCVHTSGSVQFNVLANKSRKYGSFYPLQTLTSSQISLETEIPILLETSHRDFGLQLEELAKRISPSVEFMGSEKRKKLHVAAVIVNNFTNHLYSEAQQYCTNNDLSFDLLKPLILETALKVQNNLPIDIQTGPAKRNDQLVIAEHLKILSDQEELKELYERLTKLIINSQASK